MQVTLDTSLSILKLPVIRQKFAGKKQSDINIINPAINNAIRPDFQAINQVLKAQALAKISFRGYKELETFDIPFYDNLKGKYYQLDNGQKVVIVPKPGPTVLQTYVNVGAINEPDHLKGVCHFIEHCLFKGSRKLAPGEYDKEISKTGAEDNAKTTYNQTISYIKSIFSEQDELEKMVSMQSDMILHPLFLEQEVNKERSPIISEIQGDDDEAYTVNKLHKMRDKNLFRINTKAPEFIYGSENNIRNLTAQQLKDFHSIWYTPDNMLTVIVGDVNTDKTIKLIDKYFGTAKSASDAQKNNRYYQPLIPIKKTVENTIVSSKADMVNAQLSFIGPENNNIKDTVKLDLLNYALAGHRNAILTKALNNTRANASIEFCPIDSRANSPQVITLFLDCVPVISSAQEYAPGKRSYGKLRRIIDNIIEKPISKKELELVKNKFIYEFKQNQEMADCMADCIGNAIMEHGDLQRYTKMVDMVKAITPQDIQQAAKKYFNMDKASITFLYPKYNSNSKLSFGSKFSDNIDKFKLGNIKNSVLPNNVSLVINDDPNALITSVNINLKARELPPHKPGIIGIMDSMLVEETEKHTKKELNKIIDSNNISIGTYPGVYNFGVKADCPTESLPIALDILKETLYSPSFSEKSFKKSISDIKAALLGEEDYSLEKAKKAIYEDHPFGCTTKMIRDNIDKVTLQDVKNLHDNFINNSHVQVIITGPISKHPGLENKITESLKTIPVCQDNRIPEVKVKPFDKNRVLVNVDDCNQTTILQAFEVGNAKHDIKEEAGLELLSHILGGGQDSRLFKSLRNEQGLAYSTDSAYTKSPYMGIFLLAIETSTKYTVGKKKVTQYDNVEKSIEGFRKNLRDLMEKPVNNEELESAKLAVLSRIIFGAETTSDKNETIQEGFRQDESLYIKDFIKAVEEITPEDLQKTAEKYFTKPSVFSITTNESTLKNVKPYLKTLKALKILEK